MKAAVLTKNGFVIRDQEIPTCGPDHVLVRTSSCGVCDGDVHAFQTFGEDSKERVPGHEGSGIVEEVGANVKDFAAGDAVTTLAGGFAEYFLAAPEALVRLPDAIEPRWAFGEPIACCVHAANKFGINPGDRVAVVGCGFMGLVCLQLAKAQGGSVHAIDLLPSRLEMAERVGADLVYSPEGKKHKDTLEDLGEFDMIIEAAGVQSALDLCTVLIKQHGRMSLVGYHKSNGGLRTVDMKTWNFKAIDVLNGHVRRNDEKWEAMRQGMVLLKEGKLDVRPFVTEYPLADTQQAFEDLVGRKEGLFKAALVP